MYESDLPWPQESTSRSSNPRDGSPHALADPSPSQLSLLAPAAVVLNLPPARGCEFEPLWHEPREWRPASAKASFTVELEDDC